MYENKSKYNLKTTHCSVVVTLFTLKFDLEVDVILQKIKKTIVSNVKQIFLCLNLNFPKLLAHEVAGGTSSK